MIIKITFIKNYMNYNKSKSNLKGKESILHPFCTISSNLQNNQMLTANDKKQKIFLK